MGLSNFIVRAKCYWKDRIFYPGDVLEKHDTGKGGVPPVEHFEHTGGDPLPAEIKKDALVPAPVVAPKPATPAPAPKPQAPSGQTSTLAGVGPTPPPAQAVADASAGKPVALSELGAASPQPIPPVVPPVDLPAVQGGEEAEFLG